MIVPCCPIRDMSFQDLPVEIVSRILHFVGNDNFYDRGQSALLVSKWWYELMLPILAEFLVMSTNQSISNKLHERLLPRLQRLTIHMWDSHDWPEEVGFGKLDDSLATLVHRHHCIIRSSTLRIQPELTPAPFPFSNAYLQC